MKPIHCKLVATQVGDLIEYNTMNGNRKLFMVIANQMMFDTPWVTIASITDVTVTWRVSGSLRLHNTRKVEHRTPGDKNKISSSCCCRCCYC